MNILLILPFDRTYRYRGAFRRSLSYAPLTLTTLAALIPPELGARVELVDEGVQQGRYDRKRFDVVGITCVTSSAPRAFALARHFRERGTTVILGGAHPTLNPVQCSEHADAVVAGPAEAVWPEILRRIARNEPLEKIYHGNLDTLTQVVPSRRLLPRARYLPVPTVASSRGCVNGCSFCSICAMWKRRPLVRAVDEVIDEIESLRSKKILFLDPNIIADRDHALSLFAALIPLKIRWAGLATVTLALDKELLSLAVRSGCDGILAGLESSDQAAIDSCGKHFVETDRYGEVMATFHRHDIPVLGCFVLGFDTDTKETFERILQLVDQTQIDIPRFSILTPAPGTPLYDSYKRQQRILTDDLGRYDTEQVVFRPARMEPEELQQGLHALWKRAYSAPRIAARVARARRRIPLALATNLGFRYYAHKLAVRT